MSSIIIDADKCLKDRLCIAECPLLLFYQGEDGIPSLVDGAEAACLDCGHCLAVCPGEAITLNGITADACDTVQSNQMVSTEQVNQLFRKRRSIRAYKKKPLKQLVLEPLIDMARWVPSARNGQPVSWIVVNSTSKVAELSSMVVDWMRATNTMPAIVDAFAAGHDMVHRGAPCLLIAHASSEGFRPVEDCTIAVAAIETAAPVYGLGACWAGFFMRAAKSHAPILEYLNLPEGHEVYGALMLGYPKYSYKRIPPRAEARIEWRW